jgi:hypothetical protein
MIMTCQWLVQLYGDDSLPAQQLLNAEYKSIANGKPLLLRLTGKVQMPAVDTVSRYGIANLKYWVKGTRAPITSVADGKKYPANTPMLRISMAERTAKALGAINWDRYNRKGWRGKPSVWFLASDGDKAKYRFIAGLIVGLQNLP